MLSPSSKSSSRKSYKNQWKNGRGGRRRPEKGVLLKCELRMGAPASNNQAQYPEVLLIALELECCQLGQKCLFACGVNPIFHHHSLTSHHPLTCFVLFLYESSKFLMYIFATKMGQSDPVVGQILHFGPFPFEKINTRGAQKVDNQPSPNLLFKTQDDLVSQRRCCHLVLG